MSKVIYHRHHVVPRHAGGTDDPSNIIVCTIEEHAEHHRYRYEMLGEWQDLFAWKGLLGMMPKQKLIQQILSENGKKGRGRKLPPRSDEHRRKLKESHKGFIGRKHTDTARQKIGNAHRGKIFSEEYRRKIRETHRGMSGLKHSEETRKKMSESAKNRHARARAE